MGTITVELRASLLDAILVTTLYDQLRGLPIPFFVGQRMKLPYLTFEIKLISVVGNGSEHVFCAQAGALGVVEIKTAQNLSRLDSLHLIHPWTDLLDRRPVGRMEMTSERDESQAVVGKSPHLSSTLNANRLDKPLRVLQFVARLKRPFGAPLLTPTCRNVDEYRRVAAESLITAQLPGELTPAILERLVQVVRTLDVL